MLMSLCRRLPGLLILLSVVLVQPLAAQPAGIALVGGSLIDGTGAPAVHNSIILISKGRIDSIGTMGRLPIPESYQLISTEGMTVLPGLWDLHVHLLYNGHPDFEHWFSAYADQFASVTIPASAHQFLLAGVTSVRDLAAPTADIIAVRTRIRQGEIPGPSIYTSGAALVPAAGPTRPHLLAVEGARDAAEKTRGLIDAGVDIIKILGANADSLDEMQAIVSTAHAAGLRVSAHGRSDAEIRLGLAAGVDEFQHIGTGSAQYPQDILDTIRERIRTGNPLYWSPTIGLDLNANNLAADHEFLDDPRNFVGLGPELELDVRQAIASAQFRTRTPEVLATVKHKLQQLNELGVIMVSGSDMGTFGHPASEATWRELEAWVFELGMDPLTAIRWATSDAADYMGAGVQVGTISPGKIADVIAVRGSPLRHFSVLRNPVIVIKNGLRVK
ncbi:MAG: amidohydrolase family protein [Pseudomonadales bacterium]|nr:amidohydrolase family protein [Pseudomonadales bacterium]